MTPAQFLARRNEYAYPRVGLAGSLANHAQHLFPSIAALETHHRALLRSDDNAAVVLGYLSVIYWGHFSGQDGVHRANRAKSKVDLALNGTTYERKGRRRQIQGVANIGVDAAADTVRRAGGMVDSSCYGEALRLLSSLPQINAAFASKICAFLSPETCGVIDSVIAARHPQLGFEADSGGYVKMNSANLARYRTYCRFLIDEAMSINALAPAFQWRDSDGSLHDWRAVDIERALY